MNIDKFKISSVSKILITNMPKLNYKYEKCDRDMFKRNIACLHIINKYKIIECNSYAEAGTLRLLEYIKLEDFIGDHDDFDRAYNSTVSVLGSIDSGDRLIIEALIAIDIRYILLFDNTNIDKVFDIRKLVLDSKFSYVRSSKLNFERRCVEAVFEAEANGSLKDYLL